LKLQTSAWGEDSACYLTPQTPATSKCTQVPLPTPSIQAPAHEDPQRHQELSLQ